MVEVIGTFTTPEHRWLSNMWYAQVTYQGLTYPSVENFYQAMKFDKNDFMLIDSEVVNKRYHLTGIQPNESKKFTKGKTITNKKFLDKKLEVMLYGLREKFKHKHLRTMLLSTGDAELIEGNYWNDTYWGVCLKTNTGENHLGRLLMQVREELRDEC